MRHLTFLTVIFTILMANLSFAAQPLRFKPADDRKSIKIVEFTQSLINSAQVPYNVAKIDLNGDGLDEYILKPSLDDFCPKLPVCTYTILAYQEGAPIIIGEFDAHKLLISNKKTYGIHDIIVYNQPQNDFKTTTARWTPSSFAYTFR